MLEAHFGRRPLCSCERLHHDAKDGGDAFDVLPVGVGPVASVRESQAHECVSTHERCLPGSRQVLGEARQVVERDVYGRRVEHDVGDQPVGVQRNRHAEAQSEILVVELARGRLVQRAEPIHVEPRLRLAQLGRDHSGFVEHPLRRAAAVGHVVLKRCGASHAHRAVHAAHWRVM